MGVDLAPPNIDIVSLARGFGVDGRFVENQSELEPALKWAFSHDGPALVDVLVEEDLGES
jgi:pyruvate dehydrogenase (quinone)